MSNVSPDDFIDADGALSLISVYWQFVLIQRCCYGDKNERLKKERRVFKCKLCVAVGVNKVFAIGGKEDSPWSTSNIAKHFDQHGKVKKMIESTSSSSKTSAPTVATLFASATASKVEQARVRLFAKKSYPPAHAADPAWVSFMMTVGVKSGGIRRTAMQDRLVEYGQGELALVKQELRAASASGHHLYHIMIDGWTGPNGEKVNGVCIAFFNGVELVTRRIGLVSIPEQVSSGEHYFATVRQAMGNVGDWPLARALTATADSALNVQSALKQMESGCGIARLQCDFHRLQSCIQDALAACAATVHLEKRFKDLASHLNQSPKSFKAFADAQKARRRVDGKQESVLRIPQSVCTRIGSLYYMLSRAVELQEPLQVAAGEREELRLVLPSVQDFNVANDVAEVLAPLQVIFDVVSANSYSTMPLLGYCVYHRLPLVLEPRAAESDVAKDFKGALKAAIYGPNRFSTLKAKRPPRLFEFEKNVNMSDKVLISSMYLHPGSFRYLAGLDIEIAASSDVAGLTFKKIVTHYCEVVWQRIEQLDAAFKYEDERLRLATPAPSPSVSNSSSLSSAISDGPPTAKKRKIEATKLLLAAVAAAPAPEQPRRCPKNVIEELNLYWSETWNDRPAELMGYNESDGSLYFFDAIEWWQQHRDDYPRLFRVAMAILSCPASEVECERLFSLCRYVMSRLRTRMTNATLNAEVLAHERAVRELSEDNDLQKLFGIEEK